MLRTRTRLTSVTLTIAAACASAASAETIHVPADAPTIQAGLDRALLGDTVVVADGVWMGDGNRDLVLPPFDVVLTSDNGPDGCILFSEGTVLEPHRALLVNGPHTRDTVVRGFTITGGETEEGAVLDAFNAGGVLIQSGDPTIEDCRFVNNSCSCWGGAVCVSGPGSPRFTRCMFDGNHSDAEGGAFFSWGTGRPVIDNSVFIRNTAGNEGGAIFSFNPIAMDHVTVTGNSAVFDSGGVSTNQGTLTNSIIWGNNAPFQPNVGGWQLAMSYSSVEGPTAAGNGVISADPRFRADGWRLKPHSSPCVDAGDPHAALQRGDRDLDGGLRRVGRRVDMGADEARWKDVAPL